MAEIVVQAISEAVGLRRETTVDPAQLPLWLAKLHKALPPGDLVRFSITDSSRLPIPYAAILEGAGFAEDNGGLVRLDSLPDVVDASMEVLISGLNPSPAAAAAGVPFHRAGNRFWPAALASGLVTRDRDPYAALRDHGVGFTDLVKRTTRRADQLTASEFQSGVARIERLAEWLRPRTLLVVGLGGWRAGRDPDARAGWQTDRIGSTRVYVMPNTSGLNAHETTETLAEHLASVNRER